MHLNEKNKFKRGLMKVGLIYSTSSTNLTGASAVIRSFITGRLYLENLGVNLHVYEPCVKKSSAHGENFHIKKWLKSFILKYLIHINIVVAFKILISELLPARRIVSSYIKNNNKEDIIFFHELFTCYCYLKLAPAPKKVVLVLHTNGDSFSMYKIYYPRIENSFIWNYFLSIESYVLSRVSQLGFVSKSSMNDFSKCNPQFDAQRLFYIYNGVPELYEPMSRQRQTTENDELVVISCVGTICERKGQRLIVEALHDLRTRISIDNLLIYIIGGGPYLDNLKYLVSKYSLDENIKVVGSSTDVYNYLIESDIFLLPSLDEGLPISIIEAMKVGLPIVSTKVGGIPELLSQGLNGVFIEPNVQSLINDFFQQIENYDWKSMGVESRELYKKNFTENAMIDNYVEIFKHLSENC